MVGKKVVPRYVEEARKRNLITPFVPGTAVSSNSFVVDKYGVGWWIRPDTMFIVQAVPANYKLVVAETDRPATDEGDD